MKLNDAGRKFIKDHEGCRLTSYQDVSGYWTIGFGHRDGQTYHQIRSISQQQADQLFEQDAIDVECVVTQLARCPLTQNQFNALCSFVFNLGATNFRNSTLLKRLNNKDYTGAAEQLLRWCFARDKEGRPVKNDGLLKRREAEKAVFCAQTNQ